MHNSLFLRKVKYEDKELLFKWVNDKDVRNNAFSVEDISYETHDKWFDHMMSDPNEAQYILMDDEKPCGQIRLTIRLDIAEIDYSVSYQYRGIGYGKQIIKLVKEKVKKDYPGIHKLVAKVKASNLASISCFEKNGFEKMFLQFEYDLNE